MKEASCDASATVKTSLLLSSQDNSTSFDLSTMPPKEESRTLCFGKSGKEDSVVGDSANHERNSPSAGHEKRMYGCSSRTIFERFADSRSRESFGNEASNSAEDGLQVPGPW